MIPLGGDKGKAAGWVLATVDQHAPHDEAHNFIGPFEDLMNPKITNDLLDPVLVEVTVPTVELQRFICHLKTGIGGYAFCHGTEFDSIGGTLFQGAGGTEQTCSSGSEPGLPPGKLENQGLLVG